MTQSGEPDRPSTSVGAGLRLAVTTFTVLPLRSGRVDRTSAGIAMAVAPAIGATIGAGLSGVLLVVVAAGGGALLAAASTVGAGALLTRGLHLDGLADTVDGFGSYRSGEAGLAVMKRPDIGPFGVVALVLALFIQTAALADLADRSWPSALAGVATACAAGRLAASWACRRGVPSARPNGMGALVAGTVPGWVLAATTVAVLLLAGAAVPGRPWQGPVAVLAGLAAALVLVRRAVGRFGGITGDVLGATIELATMLTLVGLALA